jgi:SulP family sulfate permease
MLQLGRLIRPILKELHPQRLLPSLTVGLVTGVLEVIFAISLASLIFSDELSVNLPTGVGLALFSILTINVSVALISSLPGVVANVQESPAVLMAVVAHHITTSMPESASASEQLLTVLTAIALTSIFTGIFFLTLGWFKLGGLIRFIPYPVVGGFLAGTGWLLVCSSLSMMADVSLNLDKIIYLLSPTLLLEWLPGIVFAVSLLAILRRYNHFLILPGMLLGAIALFYIFLILTDTSINQVSASGLLLGSFPTGNLWQPLSFWQPTQVNWLIIVEQLDRIVTIALVSVMTLLLNATGIEVAVGQDIDLNRELKAAGVANLAAGCGGGIIGFQGLALSALSHKVGANSRLVGLFIGMIAALALFSGATVLSYLPKMVLGGLLLFLGLDFLVKWVYDSWFELPKKDYFVILLILVVIATLGFLEGVGFGLLLTIILFVINYSQVSATKNICSGASCHSNVVRGLREKQILREAGQQICILELQGFIFFGTANNLLNQLYQLLAVVRENPLRFIVFDFRLVSGVDSSAILSFTKMRQILSKQQVSLVFTNVQPTVDKILRQCGCLSTKDSICQIFPDLDRGLEWCENQILKTIPYQNHSYSSLIQQLQTLFASIEQVEQFINYLQPQQFLAGEFVFRQGELPNGLYLIESGQVSVFQELANGQVKRLSTFDGGSLCGEISFYTQERHSASVVANKISCLYYLSPEALKKMEMEAPQLAMIWQKFMLNLLAERLKHREEELRCLL